MGALQRSLDKSTVALAMFRNHVTGTLPRIQAAAFNRSESAESSSPSLKTLDVHPLGTDLREGWCLR